MTLNKLTVLQNLNVSAIPQASRDVYTKTEVDAEIGKGEIPDPLFVDEFATNELTAVREIDFHAVPLADRDICLKTEVYTQSEADGKIADAKYVLPADLQVDSLVANKSIRTGLINLDGEENIITAPAIGYNVVNVIDGAPALRFEGIEITPAYDSQKDGLVRVAEANLSVDGGVVVGGHVDAEWFFYGGSL
jgi:hypothetical protein